MIFIQRVCPSLPFLHLLLEWVYQTFNKCPEKQYKRNWWKYNKKGIYVIHKKQQHVFNDQWPISKWISNVVHAYRNCYIFNNFYLFSTTTQSLVLRWEWHFQLYLFSYCMLGLIIGYFLSLFLMACWELEDSGGTWKLQKCLFLWPLSGIWQPDHKCLIYSIAMETHKEFLPN